MRKLLLPLFNSICFLVALATGSLLVAERLAWGGVAVKQSTTGPYSARSLSRPESMPVSAAGLKCTKSVALYGGYLLYFDTPAILSGAGHTVTVIDAPDILGGALSGQDVLYMDRDAVGSATAKVLSAIRAFVKAGGTLITEFEATDVAVTALEFALGDPVDTFFVPSGDVGGGSPVTVVAPANPLAMDLPSAWSSGDPIGVLRVFNSIDPALEVIVEAQSTALGDVPIVATGRFGKGAVTFYFSDFGDFTPESGYKPEEVTLLRNSICFAPSVIPDATPPRVCVVQIMASGGVMSLFADDPTHPDIAVLVPPENATNVPVRCQDLTSLGLAVANQEAFPVSLQITAFTHQGTPLCTRGPFTLSEHGARGVIFGSDCLPE